MLDTTLTVVLFHTDPKKYGSQGSHPSGSAWGAARVGAVLVQLDFSKSRPNPAMTLAEQRWFTPRPKRQAKGPDLFAVVLTLTSRVNWTEATCSSWFGSMSLWDCYK